MTEFEYLKARTEGLGVSDEDIKLLCFKHGEDGTKVITDPKASALWLDVALFKNFSIIQWFVIIIEKAAIEKISEGGYSMERGLKAIKGFYNLLKKEIGIWAYHA